MLATSSLCRLSASEIAHLIRSKQASPVEVVEEHIARIETVNPMLNAFADYTPELALAAARRAESMLMSGYDRPLLGVPLTIKSCIDVQGMRCEAGSRLRSGHIAAQDAVLVARLKRAGAIVIGNTTTPELLMAYHTESLVHGRTNNPWDLGRTPGGSSGGEAAAIASCMAAGGFGSDGGGSIRVPAHFTGICGLKPTPGRIPATGHYPACAGPFSLIGVVGPMARTIKDLQLLFAVTEGHDPADPASVPAPAAKDACATRNLRIGFYDSDGETQPTPETSAAVRSAASALQDAGFPVAPFRPEGLAQARELWSTIFVQAGMLALEPLVRERAHEISPSLREFMALAAQFPVLTAEGLLHALMERDQLCAHMESQMSDFPILLAPVSSTPAFPHEHAGWGSGHPADYFRTMTYCQHFNLLGNPAVTVPVGQSAEGLPIGVQIVGRRYQEHEVLAVAEFLNEQFQWKEPPLSGAQP
jgi:amidase